jgi:hypothetical protein
MQAAHTRDTALQETLRAEWRLAVMQADIAREVSRRVAAASSSGAGGAAVDELSALSTKLQLEFLGVTVLFNEYAVVRTRASLKDKADS